MKKLNGYNALVLGVALSMGSLTLAAYGNGPGYGPGNGPGYGHGPGNGPGNGPGYGHGPGNGHGNGPGHGPGHGGGYPGGYPGGHPGGGYNPPQQNNYDDVADEARELGQSLRTLAMIANRLEFRGRTAMAADMALREVMMFAQTVGRSCNQAQLRIGMSRVAQSVNQVRYAFQSSHCLQRERDAVRAMRDVDEEYRELDREVQEELRFPRY